MKSQLIDQADVRRRRERKRRRGARLAARAIVSLLAAVVVTINTAAAEPPSDERVDEVVASYEQALAELESWAGDARRKAADEALGEIRIDDLTFDQIDRMLKGSNVLLQSSQASDLEARLAEFGVSSDVSGAAALMYRLEFLEGKSAEEQRARVLAILVHPALTEALRDGARWATFMNFEWYGNPDAVRGLEDRLIALGDQIPERIPMLGLLAAVDIFDLVAAADPEGYQAREPLRLALIDALERGLTYVDPADPKLKHWNFARDVHGALRENIARLNSPATLGVLLDGPAPEIDFIWLSDSREIDSLSDLHGKIVVLDFWATWCGPCIAAFPKMRELIDRYEGFPVELIGVTSIQGAHYADDGPVDTEGDPAAEMSLMFRFMQAKNVTWTVAFSKQAVFNPSYDIRGIPHVVIIDHEGKVRHNNLHPGVDHDEIVRRIDELLRKMGAEPPPPTARSVSPGLRPRAAAENGLK